MENLELEAPVASQERRTDLPVVCIGIIVGIRADERIAFITYRGQPGDAAIPARGVVDLNGARIGSEVVLNFENGDPRKPIILGYLPKKNDWPLTAPPGNVEVEADGARLLVTASHQLVLRCGNASITLTKDGKVLIRGDYISSCSSGVNRVKGGTVQLN
jgi:hypothetical protein